MITVANAPVGLVTTAAAPTGYAWTAQTNQDTDPAVNPLYKWLPATYTNDPAINLVTTEKPTITGTTAAFLLNGSTPVTSVAYAAWTSTLTGPQADRSSLSCQHQLGRL